MTTMTIPRNTSTETNRGLGVRRLDVVVRTLATDGELTAVTIFHLCHQVPIRRSYFDRNSCGSPGFLQDVNKLQQISHHHGGVATAFSRGGGKERRHSRRITLLLFRTRRRDAEEYRQAHRGS